MAPRPATITQPVIARALREAKKQGCELIEIKPTGEVLIYLKTNIPLSNSTIHHVMTMTLISSYR
ncbi:formylmethanofuran dehydrogenase subunit B [Bartonella silvatica]|uniref:Formylmethanofuran dehydrogenase subunit B n=1 Tax=Bartonella silvatica TaxID=357760 RepID=A0ABV2HIA4_9HYPH